MHYLKDPVNPRRWAEMKRVFTAALEKPPTQREQFVLEACHGDEQLAAEIHGLLNADAEASSFLSIPAIVNVENSDVETQPPNVWRLGLRVSGRFQICGLVGSGGMGQVYRAWDERLRREVAIKTIRTDHSTNPEVLARFEREARALAALNHPNLLAVHDIGTQDGVAYIVSELLDGETLRSRLTEAAIPLHRALTFAIQIVRGLAAAHEKGLVHRDLKPENIFLTIDGQVKLLDFGLAKLIQDGVSIDSGQNEFETSTVIGKILGTPGYMSPEQLRGLAVDSRSDIFSFGAVFYELLTRKRAFPGQTHADVISATLNTDPQDVSQITASIPASAALIVRHCLEKRPEDRFQSARDLLFDLEVLTAPFVVGDTPFRQTVAVQSTRRRPLVWTSTMLLVAVTVFAVIFWSRSSPPPLPSFSQVTFHRTTISEARFTADGNTVLYNGSWGGNPADIFITRIGGNESRSLGTTNTDLLSVSSTGELAILVNRQGVETWFNRGTLARVPEGGGTPKEIVEDVQSADWSPDGLNLAIVHHTNGEQQLEYPIGHALFRTPGWISNIRVSPSGNEIAILEHPSQWDDRGWVSVVDLNGKARTSCGRVLKRARYGMVAGWKEYLVHSYSRRWSPQTICSVSRRQRAPRPHCANKSSVA